jgi:hypothetical protein
MSAKFVEGSGQLERKEKIITITAGNRFIDRGFYGLKELHFGKTKLFRVKKDQVLNLEVI